MLRPPTQTNHAPRRALAVSELRARPVVSRRLSHAAALSGMRPFVFSGAGILRRRDDHQLRGHNGCGRGDFSFVAAVPGFHRRFRRIPKSCFGWPSPSRCPYCSSATPTASGSESISGSSPGSRIFPQLRNCQPPRISWVATPMIAPPKTSHAELIRKRNSNTALANARPTVTQSTIAERPNW